MNRTTLFALVAVIAAIAGVYFVTTDNSKPKGVRVAVSVPQLSKSAAEGADIFDTKCASCHGRDGSGGDAGPPLIHRIYEPNHHADFAFYRAVEQGVRAHHWTFGNMPPQKSVSRDDTARIIAYIRELQKANGIF